MVKSVELENVETSRAMAAMIMDLKKIAATPAWRSQVTPCWAMDTWRSRRYSFDKPRASPVSISVAMSSSVRS